MAVEQISKLRYWEDRLTRRIDEYNPVLNIDADPNKISTGRLKSFFDFYDGDIITPSEGKILIPRSQEAEGQIVLGRYIFQSQQYLFEHYKDTVTLADFAVAFLHIIERMKNDPSLLKYKDGLGIADQIADGSWPYAKLIIQKDNEGLDWTKAQTTFEQAQARERIRVELQRLGLT